MLSQAKKMIFTGFGHHQRPIPHKHNWLFCGTRPPPFMEPPGSNSILFCSELRSPFSALLDSIQKVIEVIHIGKGRVVGQYSEDKGRTQSFMVFRN